MSNTTYLLKKNDLKLRQMLQKSIENQKKNKGSNIEDLLEQIVEQLQLLNSKL